MKAVEKGEPCALCGEAPCEAEGEHAELVEEVRRLLAWALIGGFVLGLAFGAVFGWAMRGPR